MGQEGIELPPSPSATKEARTGVLLGLFAYVTWGITPVYYKALAQVPPEEVLAHRVVWCVLLLALFVWIQGRWGQVVTAISNPRTLATLLVTTVLIGMNWYLFIWAISNDRILQASLGYFINPLLSVVLGFVFLRERLRPWQWLSVLLAAGGVAYVAVADQTLPLIALALAFCFGSYGLIRKVVRVPSVIGLGVETAFLSPLALAYLIHRTMQGEGALGTVSLQLDALLIAAGVVTAVPLLCFIGAAKRLRLATLGFMQYIAPTGHFFLAVLVYDEPFRTADLISFSFIWAGLLLYTIDSARASRTVAAKAAEVS